MNLNQLIDAVIVKLKQGWCKGTLCLPNTAQPWDREACRWCLTGAVMSVCGAYTTELSFELHELFLKVHGSQAPCFNDSCSTVDSVIQALLECKSYEPPNLV